MSNTPKVFIVGGDGLIERMFLNRGWKVVPRVADAEYIQFTGGADVSPMLYGEPKHPRTGNDPIRDDKEANLYHEWVGKKKMLGICRGGQFLNVMNGGSMYQDVDNHAIVGTHIAIVEATGKVVQVTSTHHQMMVPRYGHADVLVTAPISTRKEDGWQNNQAVYVSDLGDAEVILYENETSLCFQPHPEYVDTDHECQQLYFDLIKKHLGE